MSTAFTYIVNATLLNVRRTPSITPTNIIGRLGYGEVVEKVRDAVSGWLEIRSGALHGFVSAHFMKASPTPVTNISPSQPFIPLPAAFPPDTRATLSSTEMRHCPLGALQTRPRTAGQMDEARVAELHDIVAALDVEHSARYQPTSQSTFCNIYAYDLCYLAGAYLPRVWWVDKALIELSRGAQLPVIYGKTVRELNANSLFEWLTEWGDEFGWKHCSDTNELQAEVNRGAVGLISAQRAVLARSGHIVAVLPETSTRVGGRSNNSVTEPLQSQAGARNKQYFCNRWWIDRGPEFRAFGFWVHA